MGFLMPLSDTWLKANHNKLRESVLEKTDRDGLSARVSAKGKIKFQLRFRFDGKAQRCDIGSYPLMSLAEARKECLRYKSELEKGKDPRILRATEIAQVSANSFESLFLEWHKSKEQSRTYKQVLDSFKLHVFPVLGKYPAADLSMHIWLKFLEGQKAARPYIALRILSFTKLFYRWASKRQLVPSNPVADIFSVEDLQIEKSVTSRVLRDDEIALLFEALELSEKTFKIENMVELCLFFGCRVSELRLAEKSHFDFKSGIWTIPPENHKNGKKTKRALFRPIIPEIEDTLKNIMAVTDGKYLFPHRHEDRPVSASAHVKLPINLMATLKRCRGKDMAPWSLHDLRRTARTNWSRFTTSDVAEIMLGHALPGIQGVYDQHLYLEQQAEAYKAWFKKLKDIRNSI